MPLDIRAIEALAPDQSSLKAAAGLTKPAKWSGIAGDADGTLIWGLCAGSGANPYKVTVDLRDNGSKCTCPSRKFPCKHGLALMWMKAESMTAFPAAEAPEWVGDWLKRRRGGVQAGSAAGKDASAASQDDSAPEDPKAIARRQAAAAKRADETDSGVRDALEALDQWIGDQIRTGLNAFVEDAAARCRRIASRMVDGKAATLAGRIDEMPARILATPAGDRLRVAADELGRLVLLARAWRADPRNPAIRRSILAAETKDTLLVDPACLRISAQWEVLAERAVTRRDGLISQTTWLLNLGEGPRFAILLDFFPATGGRRGSAFSPGDQFRGEIAFYPSPHPSRAILVSREEAEDRLPWPDAGGLAPIAAAAPALAGEPWCGDATILLPPGRIVTDERSRPWWRSSCGTMLHPVAGDVAPVARGGDLQRGAAVWNANRLDMLAAETAWGRIDFDA